MLKYKVYYTKIKTMKIKRKKRKRCHVFTMRIDKKNKEWLKKEVENYESWNIFIKYLINVYKSIEK